METPGLLVVTQFPSVIVPVCVVECVSGTSVSKCVPEGEYGLSEIACVSACMKMDDGPIQMGDTSGELNRPQRVNLVTAPGSRDGSYEVHGTFRARPARARLRDPARKRTTLDTSQPRGRQKYRGVFEFGKQGFPCGRVCEAPRAACRVFCSRNARSGFPGRCARANLHGKPRRLGVRVKSSPRTSQHECWVNSAHCPAWGIRQK